MNPLAIGADATLSEGNCQIAYGNGTRSVSTANMGFASGKWYWEWKISAASTDGCSAMPGIGALPFGPDLGTYLGTNSDGYSYNGEDGQKYNGEQILLMEIILQQMILLVWLLMPIMEICIFIKMELFKILVQPHIQV